MVFRLRLGLLENIQRGTMIAFRLSSLLGLVMIFSPVPSPLFKRASSQSLSVGTEIRSCGKFEPR
jgi:hypothetical protein